MKFDLFLSICQTEVDGYLPNERTMFENFFSQVELADQLGFEIAWVGESHFSSEVQKLNAQPVIPHFKGEVALNTVILHLAHRIFHKTKKIEVGSAIRNIFCNGGPLAHAEAIKLFLSIHGLEPEESRKLHLGFASGRFPYSNRPYGIKPRNKFEEQGWSTIKTKVFLEACEIFLRALRGDIFSSEDITPQFLQAQDFKQAADWDKLLAVYRQETFCDLTSAHKIPLSPFWNFERLAVIPKEAPLQLLNLIVGSHDPEAQDLANSIFPCWIFNLSITPDPVIEKTHQRMKALYAAKGWAWKREFLPRTTLIFLNADRQLSPQGQIAKAKERAEKTVANYWRAMQGTVSSGQVEESMNNALWGNPQLVAEQIQNRFEPNDRLMLWFDFNCHDNQLVKEQMKIFYEQVVPLLA